MDYDTIFARYYTQYRAEATTPDTTDDEYTIGMRYANDAINRWAYFDNTYWRELFQTSVLAPTGTHTTTAGTASYAAPTDMKEAGGYIQLLDTNGVAQKRLPIVDPSETQFLNNMAGYVFFTGDPSNGYTLNFNVAPDTTGMSILYTYYKKPTFITAGGTKPQMSNPDFIVDSMLASRFRASRNPYYSSAKRDAENKLGQMKMANDSGTWSNPWSIPDRSGTVWGGGNSGNWTW